MKKALLFLLNMAIFGLFAQTPQAIKYQAIARNASGNMLVNQTISMRVSILTSNAEGNSLYSETHTVTTNSYGLVNLEIGNGMLVSGSFNTIDWGHGTYFVKVEADENGGSNFSLLGVSQLLSVPYALHANTAGAAATANYANTAGILQLTDEQRDTIANPQNGMVIFNLTSNCLNVYRTNNWYQVCGDCVPQPTEPTAGSDRVICTDSSVQLSANTPLYGIGTWVVLDGNGGTFSDIHDPNATFTGHVNQYHTLAWQIATSCATLWSNFTITFNKLIQANAGADQHLYDNYYTYLDANAAGLGNEGQWSLINGSGAYLSDYYYPNSYFQGNTGETYTLRWTTRNDCDTSFDDVIVAFCPTPANANAGQDITIQAGTSCVLQGNTPGQYNSGYWAITSGTGGSFGDPTQNYALFTGLPNSTYTLRWTITSVCDTSFDEVIVNTASEWTCGTTVTYGGQVYNTVQIGTQCWMKENLNIGTMVTSVYTGSSHSECSNNGIIEKYCYDNDPANCDIYGGLYDWNEMMQYTTTPGTQGICPSGFHIPTDGEWQTLVDFLGGSSVAGGKMKETGFTHWNSPNNGATNESGFTALGAGGRLDRGDFDAQQYYANFWCSSEAYESVAWFRRLDYFVSDIYHYGNPKALGFSVRCSKD